MNAPTPDQKIYIKDLIRQKLVDYVSFKKWLADQDIIGRHTETYRVSTTLNHLTNRITGQQASDIITGLQQLQDYTYKKAYDPKQIQKVKDIIARIEKEIDSWTFTQS